MLNRYSEKAAAAMSSVNQFSYFIQLLYLLVAAGLSILIAQGLGAGRREEAGRTATAGMILMTAFALAISVAVFLLARPILGLYALEADVREMAIRFLAIYGAGSFFMAMNIAQANILRAYGRAADVMAINAVALAVTILGNAVSRYFSLGFGLAILAVIGLNLAKAPVLAFFTDDGAIVAYAAAALLVSLALEPGRCLNTIIIPALKGSGDTLFPVLVGICFQWGVGVSLAWLFGLKLGLGLAGAWIALACDEWSRGTIMALRWRSGAWRSKALIRGE
jgi:Na+-driven multidrug efflux pump